MYDFSIYCWFCVCVSYTLLLLVGAWMWNITFSVERRGFALLEYWNLTLHNCNCPHLLAFGLKLEPPARLWWFSCGCSGIVTLNQFLLALDLPRTQSTEEVFNLFDKDGTGHINFREVCFTAIQTVSKILLQFCWWNSQVSLLTSIS